MKEIYIDLETGGLDYKVHPILQISLDYYENTVRKDELNLNIYPDNDQPLDKEALIINGLKEEPLRNRTLAYFITQKQAYNKIVLFLDKYINKYDKKDKAYFIGYNCHSFDEPFLRKLFENNSNPYIGSYFWYPSIDVMHITAFLAIGQRHKLGDFKLPTVAKSLGIEVDKDKLHNATYDVYLTRQIYELIKQDLNKCT